MDRYEGFREFLRARQQSLMRSSYLLCGDPHQAEDLLQTVLIRVARNWHKLAKDGNPEAYARRALINEHISWWRRHRRHLPLMGPPKASHDPSVESVNRLALGQALDRLTPRQRAVLVLRYYEDRSVQETAELLKCSPGTVKSQTSHALGRLRVLAPELADLLNDADAKEAAR
ncbi:SigE family RNA polymerase sigma factor [Acrocarpospora macrocephala]|uniref:DNA-directed RNA polymerase sigma-70 factor n=1 Tax=Acrocarpospora macrocephala TaxID=150177 RepID=A0A5M3WNE8_9ACTN|nr:SigE family RNA polymerase sigma factor [Acrocarpospora macrocephala]GES08283.1 DNA-directed RNA polymerase sigma-70 factor [Acrocarpospora macrocephala]